MFGNYRYSLTSDQQREAQLFLRFLPEKARDCPAWELLHRLTYAESWTEEPEHDLVDLSNVSV